MAALQAEGRSLMWTENNKAASMDPGGRKAEGCRLGLQRYDSVHFIVPMEKLKVLSLDSKIL